MNDNTFINNDDKNSPYISSGTWSLLGFKNDFPVISDIAYKTGYSNEFGPDYIRVQKNIMGLWITQCLKEELNTDFVSMAELAKTSDYKEIYDVNEKCFFAPNNMKETIEKLLLILKLNEKQLAKLNKLRKYAGFDIIE